MAETTAEIVSVGTELLLGQIVDTHAPTMARLLAECGIACMRRQTVGDNMERVVQAITEALSRADVVITVGGLGPTQDDLTRPAIAQALGDKLVREPEVEEKLRQFFAERKVAWVESNANQADRPESATLIDNPNGSAPGLLCQKNGKVVIALPGPKGEFNPMANGPVRTFLSQMSGGQVIHSRILRVCGIGESAVEAAIQHLMQAANPSVAPYAKTGEVHLRVTARAATVHIADALLDPVEQSIRDVLGNAVYGTNETTLEEAVLAEFRQRGATVAVAESMTGGWLGQRFTSVPGSSDVFLGGVISYSIGAKKSLLGVSEATLELFGAVSEECASEMALGVQERMGSTYAVSITGNAGPTAEGGKPVGLAYIGIAGPGGCEVREIQYRGIRDDIRLRMTQAALVSLRSAVLRS